MQKESEFRGYNEYNEKGSSAEISMFSQDYLFELITDEYFSG
jgi:hypothetical protein